MQRPKRTVAWDPSDHAAYLLGRAARLFSRRADDRLRNLGFGAAQVPVLRALKDGDAKSQTELATLAQIEQPTMAQMLARMERDGIVRRTPNPADRRSTLFSLTPSFLAKIADARRVLVLGSDELLAGLTPSEVTQLTALLLRMVANLES